MGKQSCDKGRRGSKKLLLSSERKGTVSSVGALTVSESYWMFMECLESISKSKELSSSDCLSG